MSGPLAGIRVLDLTNVIMGPYVTQILAGLGCEVIKVEGPKGDNMRHVVPMRHPGMGHIYLHLNRGKKSLVLDLKTPRGREALLRLVPVSDVFISNIRPQALKRLGLDYDTLAGIHSGLVYVNCCGYDPDGPYAGQPAYDDLVQGRAGVPWLMQRYCGGEPRYAPVNLSDRLTGLHAVYAVSAALYAREKTGRGQKVDVPMFESTVQFVLGDHMGGLTFDPPEGDPGYARLLTPHRRPYRTRDGYLCVLIYNDKQWRSFLSAIGDTDLFEREERFCSHTSRARNIDALYAWVGGIMQTRTTAEWRRLLDEADIPNTPMNAPGDILSDPHLRKTGFIRIEEHPSEGLLFVMGTPTKWSGTPTSHPLPAPGFGEHSAQFLREVGYSDDEIRSMAEEGAVIMSAEKSR